MNLRPWNMTASMSSAWEACAGALACVFRRASVPGNASCRQTWRPTPVRSKRRRWKGGGSGMRGRGISRRRGNGGIALLRHRLPEGLNRFIAAAGDGPHGCDALRATPASNSWAKCVARKRRRTQGVHFPTVPQCSGQCSVLPLMRLRLCKSIKSNFKSNAFQIINFAAAAAAAARSTSPAAPRRMMVRLPPKTAARKVLPNLCTPNPHFTPTTSMQRARSVVVGNFVHRRAKRHIGVSFSSTLLLACLYTCSTPFVKLLPY